MRTGPKYKICKRLGSGVFEKCQTQRFTLSEARTAKNKKRGGRKSLSDYGKQLLEKQKLRYTYGVTEQQLRRYVKNAVSKRGIDSARELLRSLEARLDNVVYRSGLGSTRSMARQMVAHGHIAVNGKRVTVPSYHVREGDRIAVREGSRSRTLFSMTPTRLEGHGTPPWLMFDNQKLEGKVTSEPAAEQTEQLFDLGVVLEFYSR